MTVRQTSIKTYYDLGVDLGRFQRAVFSAFCSVGYPCTDSEIIEMFGFPYEMQPRARRNELVKMGFLCEDGKRKCKVTGRLALVWKVV